MDSRLRRVDWRRWAIVAAVVLFGVQFAAQMVTAYIAIYLFHRWGGF